MMDELGISRECLLKGLSTSIEEIFRETSKKAGLILFGSRSVDLDRFDLLQMVQSGKVRLPRKDSDVDLFYVDFESDEMSCVGGDLFSQLSQNQSYNYPFPDAQKRLIRRIDAFLYTYGIRRHPILYIVNKDQLLRGANDEDYGSAIRDSRCKFFLKNEDSIYIGSDEEEINESINRIRVGTFTR